MTYDYSWDISISIHSSIPVKSEEWKITSLFLCNYNYWFFIAFSSCFASNIYFSFLNVYIFFAWKNWLFILILPFIHRVYKEYIIFKGPPSIQTEINLKIKHISQKREHKTVELILCQYKKKLNIVIQKL